MPLYARVKYIIIIATFNLLTYFGIQKLATSNVVNLLTPLDQAIPLIPEFIWIYNSLIPVLLISCIMLLRTKKVFWTACVAFLVATVVLDVFYVVMPSFYPRESFEIANASTWFLNLTREIDGSNNTFPSGHVALSWLLFWATSNAVALKNKKKAKLMFALWAFTISLSTLTLKQHYIVDVIGGFVLAWGSWIGAQLFIERFTKKGFRQEPKALVDGDPQLAE